MKTMCPTSYWSFRTVIAMTLFVASVAYAERPIDITVPCVPPVGMNLFQSSEQILLIDPSTRGDD